MRIEVIHGRPVLDIPGQILYGAYSNNSGGLAVLDVGLQINMDFNEDAGSGDVTSLTYKQTGLPTQEFGRIRHGGELAITMAGGENPISLSVTGEGDRDYPLECSTDLQTWTPLGMISIWTGRTEPLTSAEKYYRIREP